MNLKRTCDIQGVQYGYLGFTKKYLFFNFSDSNWLPIRDSELPSTRPGSCVEDSTSLPESHLNFIKRHSLMDDTVPSNGHGPIFVKTSMNERLTAIAVDPGVKTPGDDNADQYDVSTSDLTNFFCQIKTLFFFSFFAGTLCWYNQRQSIESDLSQD